MPLNNDQLQPFKGADEEMMKKIEDTIAKNSADIGSQLKATQLSELKQSTANERNDGTISKMPAYIGTKVVCAIPMDSYTFNVRHRGFKGDSETAPGYMVQYEDGYKSWSPKDVFERSYRLITYAERILI